MVLVTQRRRHPSRRMLLVLIMSVLVRHCEPMSTKRLTDPSFSSPTLTRNSGESRSSQLGSPSELAWQAWLLVDSQTGGAHSGMDSATFLRRITPKSVFIAPALPALPPCADGYRADAMGRCVKTVNINQEAHFDFLLQRLNNRYANRGNYGHYNSQRRTTGPLQLNIPLLSDTDTNSFHGDQEKAKDPIKGPAPPKQDVGPKAEKHLLESLAAAMYQKCNINRKENESSFTREDTGNAPVVKDNRRVSSEGREPFEAIVRIYQPKNSTGVEESESGFSYNDSSTVASDDDRQVSKRPLEITVTRYQANNNSKVEGESTFFDEIAGTPASKEGQPSKKQKESLEIVGYQSKNNSKEVESETDSFDDNSTASSNVQETSGEEDLPPEIADVYDTRNNDTEEEHTFFDEEESTTIIPDEEASKKQPLEIMVPNYHSNNNSKKEAGEEEGIREEEEENASSYFDEITSTIASESDYERFYNEGKESPEVTDYQTRNDSRNEESEEPNFSYENTSTVTSDKDDEGTTSRLDDDAVPVADFVDDANDTSFSDVVDYKIPLDLRTLLNMPSVRTLNSSDDHDLWWDE